MWNRWQIRNMLATYHGAVVCAHPISPIAMLQSFNVHVHSNLNLQTICAADFHRLVCVVDCLTSHGVLYLHMQVRNTYLSAWYFITEEPLFALFKLFVNLAQIPLIGSRYLMIICFDLTLFPLPYNKVLLPNLWYECADYTQVWVL